jgi:hypothetical protein
MSWNYRVIEFTEPDGNKVRAIHEVFYTDYPEAKILTGYSESPAAVLDDSDDPTILFKILIRMSEALLLDVIPAERLDKKEA